MKKLQNLPNLQTPCENLSELAKQLKIMWDDDNASAPKERDLINKIFCELKIAMTKLKDYQVHLLYKLAAPEEKTDIDIICHNKLEATNIRKCLNSNPELMVALYMHAPCDAISIWEGALV